MTELAKTREHVSLREIGERMHISDGYLEEIAASLVKAKLIQGRKGPGGGYVLIKTAQDIHLDEVVEAIEGPVDLVGCFEEGACPVEKSCSSKRIWDVLRLDIQDSLQRRTLADTL